MQPRNRCMSRERGFDYEAEENGGEFEWYLKKKKMEEEEKKLEPQRIGPKDQPRFKHPDKKKLMAAVKSDIRLLKNSSNVSTKVPPKATIVKEGPDGLIFTTQSFKREEDGRIITRVLTSPKEQLDLELNEPVKKRGIG